MTHRMRRIVFVLVTVVALAGVVADMVPASGQADGEAVKDSKKYASTGGWGFAQFNDSKPADEVVHSTCFPCHRAVSARDFVFTQYAR